jgi:hypothetical protein
MHFYILQEIGTPGRDLEEPICLRFSFAASSFLIFDLPAKFYFAPCILWLHHKMHFYNLQEVGTPCRDPEGPILGHFCFAASSLLLS